MKTTCAQFKKDDGMCEKCPNGERNSAEVEGFPYELANLMSKYGIVHMESVTFDGNEVIFNRIEG